MKKILFVNPITNPWLGKPLGMYSLYTFLAILLIGLVISCLVINYFEGKEFSYSNLYKSFEKVIPFLLGEYGNLPEKETSRIISLLLFIAGALVLAVIIGNITSFLVVLRMGVKMPKKSKNHIVICNWNEHGDRIIKEIHSPLAKPKTVIDVITEKKIKEEEFSTSPEYRKVYFTSGSPTSHDMLNEVNAYNAKSVIILADSPSDSSDPDDKTVLIALAIRSLKKGMGRKPHIVSEVINHQKIQHLIDAGVDEWVCPGDYGLGIIAQCALRAKLSEVYQQLLRISEDTNEIYMVDRNQYPEDFKGMTYKEVSGILNDKRNSKNPTILIGLKRDNIVKLNPKEKEFEKIKDGDTLIVMAFKQPNLIRDLVTK